MAIKNKTPKEVKPSKKKKSKASDIVKKPTLDSIDDFDFDLVDKDKDKDDDYYDFDDTDYRKEDDKSSSPISGKLPIIIGGGIVSVIIIIIIAYVLMSGGSKPAPTLNVPPAPKGTVTTQQTQQPQQPTVDPSKYNPKTYGFIPSKDLIVGMNGKPVNTSMQSSGTTLQTGFVQYEKERVMFGKGMMYCYLNVVFEGNHSYRIQVPYELWQSLTPQGIVVVEYEVVTTQSGAKFVTYMKVMPNYKTAIQKYNQEQVQKALQIEENNTKVNQ